jgi:hypothetical protein
MSGIKYPLLSIGVFFGDNPPLLRITQQDGNMRFVVVVVEDAVVFLLLIVNKYSSICLVLKIDILCDCNWWIAK